MQQQFLPLPDELIVDNFAGGGGASIGIERGVGRSVDVAINHDDEAIAMHRANHPETVHYTEDVWKVDPHKVTGGQPVGLAWFSPDCKHFSKAKGRRPVSKKIRGLAWVVVRWARRVRPRVIMLENVEEFQDWGPVGEDGIPCKKRKGQTFQVFVSQLERYGYRVEWRQLRACDYGAPTIRKRLFLVARRDGLPIEWPEPTHGDPNSEAVKAGKLAPWRTAAECIDWSISCPSIFERKRPLAENTLKRIARGIQRYVLEDPEPFVVRTAHTSGPRWAAPHVSTMRNAGKPFNGALDPMHTITANGAHKYLVAAFMAQHNGGFYDGAGRDLRAPVSTIMGRGSNQQLVTAFLATYYGNSSIVRPDKPAFTVTSRDRLQLVTVKIDGETYVLTDIGMRMLQPAELYRAQGFPADYVHDHGLDADGNQVKLTKTAQVRMCGNSVCPPLATALVRANFRHEAQWKQEQAA